MSPLSAREQTLVALGAAIASNCVQCIEYHIPAARRAGLSDSGIREAIQIADKVRRVPARLLLETALARIGEPRNDSAEGSEARCGCADPS